MQAELEQDLSWPQRLFENLERTMATALEQVTLNATSSIPVANDPLCGVRILFLVDEISAITDGGTERQILQAIDICKRIGMLPHLCVFRGTRWLTPEIAGCPVTHFQIPKLASWRGLRSLVHITRWMSSQNFDILQTWFPEANLIGPCIGRLAGIPVVLGTRRNLNHACASVYERALLYAQAGANLLVNRVIANSQAVLNRIVETEFISRKRICVVYNGIDLSKMKPAPELRVSTRRALGIRNEEILVGNISGLRAIKGVDLFVDAAAEAYLSNPRLRFVVVGDGEMKARIEEAIRNYRIEGVVRLVGAAADVRPYLAAFDMAVLSSLAEGFSNSLLEYMANGVPVIATNIGGNPEALGSCGLLIKPDAHQLAQAIQNMSCPEIRHAFAESALLRVKDFDLAIARGRMREIYTHFLTQPASRKRPPAQFIAHRRATAPQAEKI